MTVHRSRVAFDDTAEVLVKGTIDGRPVEYTGVITSLECAVDDGFDENSWYRKDYISPVVERTTYSFQFESRDGKAITAKIGKKKVAHTASTFFSGVDTAKDVDKAAAECGAPAGAEYDIRRADKKIIFTWEEEV